ncbi:hypothetical protein BD309DRAFT_663799 [Dichomitus squalens]|nr:hypothetical protein BD309DRAFT_663799 [Dichomitus squalens]
MWMSCAPPGDGACCAMVSLPYVGRREQGQLARERSRLHLHITLSRAAGRSPGPRGPGDDGAPPSNGTHRAFLSVLPMLLFTWEGQAWPKMGTNAV